MIFSSGSSSRYRKPIVLIVILCTPSTPARRQSIFTWSSQAERMYLNLLRKSRQQGGGGGGGGVTWFRFVQKNKIYYESTRVVSHVTNHAVDWKPVMMGTKWRPLYLKKSRGAQHKIALLQVSAASGRLTWPPVSSSRIKPSRFSWTKFENKISKSSFLKMYFKHFK